MFGFCCSIVRIRSYMLPRPLRGFDILLCIAYEARPTVQCISL